MHHQYTSTETAVLTTMQYHTHPHTHTSEARSVTNAKTRHIHKGEHEAREIRERGKGRAANMGQKRAWSHRIQSAIYVAESPANHPAKDNPLQRKPLRQTPCVLIACTEVRRVLWIMHADDRAGEYGIPLCGDSMRLKEPAQRGPHPALGYRPTRQDPTTTVGNACHRKRHATSWG